MCEVCFASKPFALQMFEYIQYYKFISIILSTSYKNTVLKPSSSVSPNPPAVLGTPIIPSTSSPTVEYRHNLNHLGMSNNRTAWLHQYTWMKEIWPRRNIYWSCIVYPTRILRPEHKSIPGNGTVLGAMSAARLSSGSPA